MKLISFLAYRMNNNFFLELVFINKALTKYRVEKIEIEDMVGLTQKQIAKKLSKIAKQIKEGKA